MLSNATNKERIYLFLAKKIPYLKKRSDKGLCEDLEKGFKTN
jgi:hypothetical protein